MVDAFDTDVNGLPLSLIISWYEQKAVADLLALLSLGIKGIYLGPILSALDILYLICKKVWMFE